MRIWLITIGEPVPIDGDNERLLRTGILAKLLVERGHQVVWWTSTFDHPRKRHRFEQDTITDINDHFRIRHLHGTGYQKNISLKRMWDHYLIARKFKQLAPSEPVPQVILCSLPPLELCLEATKYGQHTGTPVVLDMRDLWPDIFLDVIPTWGQLLAKLLFWPMFHTIRQACTNATAITGITPPIVEWGIGYANRPRTEHDRDFPHGYTEKTPSSEAIAKAHQFWKNLGLRPNNNEFIVCFFAGLGHHIELETVIKAARKLQSQSRPFRFVLCGNFEEYQSLAQGCNNLVLPGWVGAAEIWTLMRMSSAGLVPIRSRYDFKASIPNKAIEYMSAGLPIVSSLQGFLADTLATYHCGVTYGNDDSDRLVQVLYELYDQPEQVKIYSQNAYMLYQEKFTASKVYNDMGDYLEEISQ